MKRSIRHYTKVLAITAGLLTTFQSLAFAKRLVPVDADPAPGKGVTVTVRTEKGVLAGAQVWIENVDGKLLAEGMTAADGHFTGDISDTVLNSGVSITAHATHHGAVSFLENKAHRVMLELTEIPVDSYSTLTGKLTGFKESDDESKAQLGLVAKAMEMSDLVQLDSSSFISPMKDTIDLLGKRNIPSNIVLPDQTFPVYFIPVHVDKPVFRLPVLEGTSSHYFGVTGAVVVQDAINVIRGSNAWDIINLLEFQKVGLTAPVPVPAPATGQMISLDVTTNTAIGDTLKLHPGRNTSSGETKRLAVALWEPLPGVFVPTDIKQVLADDVSLATVETRSAKVLDVLIDTNGDHFRGEWVNKASAAIPEAGLTADVTLTGLNNTWMVRGGEDAQLILGHVEERVATSVGGHRYNDRWVVVGPRKTQLRLPAVAYKALLTELGKISHVSVDLLQLGHASYPFIKGEISSSELSVLEKVRKEIH